MPVLNRYVHGSVDLNGDGTPEEKRLNGLYVDVHIAGFTVHPQKTSILARRNGVHRAPGVIDITDLKNEQPTMGIGCPPVGI